MLSLLYPLLCWQAATGGGAWLFSGLALNLAIVPVIDTLFDARELPRGLQRFLLAAPWLWLLAIVQPALLIWVITRYPFAELRPWQWFLLSSTFGLAGGSAGLTAAHELIHRRRGFERQLGLLLLFAASYPQFRVQHLYRHHPHVGTAMDPATPRGREAFPKYFARALIGGFIDAWRLEIERSRRLRRASSNRMAWYTAGLLALYTGIYAVAGGYGLLFMALQSLVAVHLLEAVNYVQHYGVRRRRRPDGTLEPIGPAHSRDSSSPLAALLTFNLPRHARHHEQPALDRHALDLRANAARLPLNFYTMVFAATVPPLWHRLMRNVDAKALEQAP